MHDWDLKCFGLRRNCVLEKKWERVSEKPNTEMLTKILIKVYGQWWKYHDQKISMMELAFSNVPG